MLRTVFLAVLTAGLLAPTTAGATVREARMAALEDPMNVEVWIALGDAYASRGRRAKAVAAYSRALSLDPDNEVVQAKLSESGSGRVAALERRALRNPEDDELWGDLGDKYASIGDRVSALRYYTYAMKLDPQDSEWRQRIMEYGGAEAVLDVLQELSDAGTLDDEITGDMGDSLDALGRHDEACDMWTKAAELDPTDSEWADKLVACGVAPVDGASLSGDPMDFMGLTGGLIGALGGFDSVDSDAMHLAGLGRTALLAGDDDEALDHYERALELAPTYEDALFGAMVLTGQSRLQILERMSEQLPAHPGLWGALGDARVDAGDFDGAEAAYGRALESDPEDPVWTSKIAVVRSKTGGGLDLSPE